jgi:hypothetical protein
MASGCDAEKMFYDQEPLPTVPFISEGPDHNSYWRISVKAAILSCKQYYFFPWRAIGAVYPQLVCQVQDSGIQIAGAP